MLQPDTIFANGYLLNKKIGIGGFSEVWKPWNKMEVVGIIAKSDGRIHFLP